MLRQAFKSWEFNKDMPAASADKRSNLPVLAQAPEKGGKPAAPQSHGWNRQGAALSERAHDVRGERPDLQVLGQQERPALNNRQFLSPMRC